MRDFFKIILLVLLSSSCCAGLEEAKENRALEQQMQGNFPQLPREGLPHSTIQQAWSKSKETDGIKHIKYSPHKRVVIATREFMSTEILLPSWEQIEQKNIVVGDPESFMVRTVAPNLVSIQPVIAGADTSLKILGNSGWLYSFYVVSHSYNSNQLPDLAVNVHVPGPRLALNNGGFIKPVLIPGGKMEDKPADDYLEKTDLSSAVAIDFNYTMYGDQTIAPERVYATDTVTVLDYGSKRLKENDLPRVLAVIDGVDTPINNVMQDNKLIVWHKGILSLQHGVKVTCVFPSALAPKSKGRK